MFERFAAKAAPGFEWQVFADVKKKFEMVACIALRKIVV